MRYISRFALVLLFFGVAPPCIAQEQERIISFHSDITVNEDSSITVLETIQIYASGDIIKRGIVRKLPSRYPVTRVERDGRSESHHFEDSAFHRNVYFGEEDVLLRPGVYTYTLEYQVIQEVLNLKTHDEVYWNVTGLDWPFSIESASATVIVPDGVTANDVTAEAYTGGKGSKGQNYTTSIDPDGAITYKTTRSLIAGEGLTVVATFPKGFVNHPAWVLRLMPRSFFSPGSKAALMSSVLLLIYFMIVWFMVGRDPATGRIVPSDHPPEGFSPAACHFILNMGYHQKVFTIALVSMAIKGALRIKPYTEKVDKVIPSKSYSISKVGDYEGSLEPEEDAVSAALFSEKDELMLSETNRKFFTKAQTDLAKTLKANYGTGFFNRNGRYYWPGLLAMYVLLIRSGYLYGEEALMIVLFMTVWLSIWTIVVIGLWSGVYTLFRDSARSKNIGKFVGGFVLGIFACFFSLFEVMGLGMLVGIVSPEFALALVANIILLVVFFRLLKAPTKPGRDVLDQLEGFQSFLRGDGQHRFATSVDDSVEEVYERYLPYAMAVGEEHDWSGAFESELAQASKEHRETTHYHPIWYDTSSSGSFDVGSLGTALSGAFSSALSSASSSSSSSGSGGGGSSGGGGGGGGGGGW
ncbi:MAG: DUF2207 domain-containing protein [Candidatus Hydrogenedentota bacterium]